MHKLTDEEFNLLAKYIKEYSGIHLKYEKKTMLQGRLQSLVAEMNMKSFMEFYQFIKNDKEGVVLSKLIDRVTTNHTYFMREAEHFTYFKSEVLPFLEKTVRNRDLRIWCAASSSGEEPYTIAMLLEDYFGDKALHWDKKLLATDISVNILDTAKRGIYAKERIKTIPKMWAVNYFDSSGHDMFTVKDKIKNQVIYRRFNLLEPIFPFKRKFHVIFCRNVMIYFDQETKVELINKFYNALEFGGYLFIGHSESVDRNRSQLTYIKPAVYRKLR